jgi:hypothetical protein
MGITKPLLSKASYTAGKYSDAYSPALDKAT